MSGDRNEDYEQYVRWRTEDDPNEFVITRAEFEKTTELLDKVRKGILTKPVVYRNPQDRNPYEPNSYNPHLWSDYIRENLPEHVQKYRDHVAKEKRKRFNQSEIVVTAELVDHALQCGKDAAYKNYVSYMEKKSSISGIKLPILTQEQFEKHKNHIRSKHGFLSTVRNYPLSFEEDTVRIKNQILERSLSDDFKKSNRLENEEPEKALSGRERHLIMTQLEFEGRRQLWIRETAEHESQMRLQRLNEEIEKINKRYRKQMWFGRIAFLVVGIGAFLILCSCAHVSDKSVTIENLYVDDPEREIRI